MSSTIKNRPDHSYAIRFGKVKFSASGWGIVGSLVALGVVFLGLASLSADLLAKVFG